MLNEKVFETEQFATEAVATVTVSPAMLQAAANDNNRRSGNIGAAPQRRNRRQSLFTPSSIGGWKVRMW